MTQREPVRHRAKRVAAVMMLFSLLGAAGCMTWHRAVTSVADDFESVIDPASGPAEQANDTCEEFGCLP